MHEMAIAEGILSVALGYGEKNKAKRIGKIALKIGEMSGVEIDALNFSFKIIAAGTLAEGAELAVERVPLVGKCHKCGREMPVKDYNFWCPYCENGVLNIVSGREMQVAYLEVE